MLLTSKRRTVTGQGSEYWSAPSLKEALIDYKLPAHRLYGALKPDQPSSVSLLPSAVVAKFCHLLCVARLQKWHQPPHPPPGANDVIIFYATLIRPPLAGTFFCFDGGRIWELEAGGCLSEVITAYNGSLRPSLQKQYSVLSGLLLLEGGLA